MKRFAFLIMLLAFSTWAVGQTAMSTAPATSAQSVIVPGTVNTSTGTAVIIAPPSAPVMVTPEVHLTTVNPGIGASNATAGNTAGASNATTELPVPPRIVTTVPQYATAVPSVTMTTPPEEVSAPASAAPGGTGRPVVVVSNQPPLFDRGVGSGSMLVAGGNTGGQSLGEIAREYRQRESSINAHVYTNQDIDRLNQQPGVTVGGMTGAAIGAGNAAGTQQQPSGNLPVVSEPSTPATPQPGVSQPVPPTTNPPRSQATPPAAQQNEATQMAQANPAAQPGAAQQGGHRVLPSSASILPLMALVGVLAAGTGLLAR